MPNLLTYLQNLPGETKRKELNYGQLWESFRQSQRNAEKWAADHNIYGSGQHQPVDIGQVEKHFENELQKNNENGNNR